MGPHKTGISPKSRRMPAVCGAVLLWLLAVPAQALVVTVNLGWGYNYGGAGTDVNLNNYNLQVGSIVQVIMYDSSAAYPANQPPGTSASANFDVYGNYTGDPVSAEPYPGGAAYPGEQNIYMPDTTPEGHIIAYTATIQEAAYADGQGDTWYQIYAQFEVLGTYDRLYIRVFGATEFPLGELVSSYWGISTVQNATNVVIDTWYVGPLDEVTATNRNYFEVIPEPGSMALFALGGAGLLAGRRRRKQSVQEK